MTSRNDSTRPPPWIEPRTAYLHVPFCAHHCGYCDFAVAAGQDRLIEHYLDAIEREMETLGSPRPVETLFIGGGTPTYLSAGQLDRFLTAVNRWLPLPLTPLTVGEGLGARVIPSPSGQRGVASPQERGVRGEGDILVENKEDPHPRPLSQRERGVAQSPSPSGREVRGEGDFLSKREDTHPRPSPKGQRGVACSEFSIESTPESLSPEKVSVLAAHGVTRVSIGVQSFRPELLSALDRRHTTGHIPLAVDAVRQQGLDLSLDLIFAAPGATLASWEADLDAALAHSPEHISTYGLTYEKGTPLWKQRERGAVAAVPEDSELAMYELAIDRLAAAGFEHYEVSNFGRPGHRCKHNERYWANEAYYGFGVGAARYVAGIRELNTRDARLYIRKVLAGESPTFQSERLADRERAFETIGTQIRRADGIARDRFREQTGFDLDAIVGPRLVAMVEVGLLADRGDRVHLTRRGFCVADGVIEDLMKDL